jgi:hypothetical protein
MITTATTAALLAAFAKIFCSCCCTAADLQLPHALADAAAALGKFTLQLLLIL